MRLKSSKPRLHTIFYGFEKGKTRFQKGYPKVGNMDFCSDTYQVQNFVTQSADFPKGSGLNRQEEPTRPNVETLRPRSFAPSSICQVIPCKNLMLQPHNCRSVAASTKKMGAVPGVAGCNPQMQHAFAGLEHRHHSRLGASSLRTFSSMSLPAVIMRILKSFTTTGCKFGNGKHRALQCIKRLWTRLALFSMPYAIPGVSLMQRMSTKLLASLKEKPQESTAG